MITKITNGRLIVGGEILPGQDLYLENGSITAITREDLPFDRLVDAGGSYVSPGFIDLHLHGAKGFDFADGTVEAVITAANHHCRHGSTTLFPTTLSSSLAQIGDSLAAVREAKRSADLLPNIPGVHLEGPYFSKKQCGAQNPDFITPPVPADYLQLLDSYSDVICRWSYAPELPGAAEFQQELNKRGVISSAGHSDAIYDDLLSAYDAGLKLITHMYSCTSTITREKGFRRLGVIEFAYLMDDVVVEAIADGCHIPKELFRLLYKIKGGDNICLVTDAMNCCGIDAAVSSIGGVPCKIKNGVACLMDESAFAGSIATADRLVRFAVKDVGLSVPEAVKMMTANPARVMGLTKKGRLEAGMDGDILIFDEDIRIQKVFAGGKEVAL